MPRSRSSASTPPTADLAGFRAPDAGFAERVRASFDRQPAMTLIGARMTRVAAGEVDIELPFDPRLTQQHGFMHAGIIGTALDSACGFASLTLMPADAGILTIEYKVNLLSPGRGVRLRVTGRVRKAGRTITLAEGDAIAIAADGTEKLVATMTATEMTIIGRDEVKG